MSEAVASTLDRLNPDRKIKIHTRQADGVPACRAMIEALKKGERDANFYEGMGCVGGCVGGPKAVIDKQKARAHVAAYGETAAYKTPIDNPFVMELLKKLGFDTVDQLTDHESLFTRRF